MVKPTASERLDHVLEAIMQIEAATAGMCAATFETDRFVRLGVERCVEIISEAVRHIPEDWKTQHAHIPWRRVADIGNRIRHSYHAVDSQLIWTIVVTDLDVLKRAIVAMKQP
jgi:uncharacterized protein with HEPN domain